MIGGGYLVYMGSRLISEVMKSQPTNETLFFAFGAFFIIFGVILVGVNLKKIYDIIKSEKESDVIAEDIDYSEEPEKPFVQKKEHTGKSVQMVNLKSEKAEDEETEAEDSGDKELKESEADDIEEAEDDEEEFFDEKDEYPDEDDEYLDEEDEEFEADEDEDLFETKLERI